MRYIIVSVLITPIIAVITSAQQISLEDFPQARRVHEDAILLVPELIEKNGYPIEVHQVESEDGYVLEMHRVPYGVAENANAARNKAVAFVMHGILCSSADWVLAGPQKALAYILADRGYDVWMGNARGCTYSRKHKTLSPNASEFWDFTWHEIGVYDLPAMIDYTLEYTGQQQLFYIGHSQGTTAFYVMAAELPDYNNKIRAHFSLAPIAYMNHLYSPLLRVIALFQGPLSLLLNMIGMHEFMPNTGFLAQIGDQLCGASSTTQFMCTNAMFVICGFSLEQMNADLVPIIMGHCPAGSSTKQILHYAQLVSSFNGHFRQFDHGMVKNMVLYKSLKPPEYDLSKITAPMAIFYSRNDWLSGEEDVLRLFDDLTNPIGRFLVDNPNFNHLDYLWGNDADTLVYDQVFELMAKY